MIEADERHRDRGRGVSCEIEIDHPPEYMLPTQITLHGLPSPTPKPVTETQCSDNAKD